MMRILYDHQMFTMQRFGGVTRYFAELMAGLPEVGYEACLPAGLRSDNYYLKETVGYPVRAWSFPGNFRIRRRLYYGVNQWKTRWYTRRGDYDLLHPTWYDPYVLRGRRKPLVITVHDMIQERFAADFRIYDRSMPNKRRLMREADHIIAVSHCTKADIVAIAGIAPEKISVVHHGYRGAESALSTLAERAGQGSASFPSVSLQAFPPPLAEHYVLYVGDRRKYKNFTTFIRAMRSLLQADRRLSVMCAGAPFSEAETALFARLGIGASQIRAIQATDAQLTSLYRHAELFVYPSLYEGFGIPILEAFANGCPVCLSRASCFPEVAGEAAVYFDPASSDDMQAAIERVLGNKSEAERLRKAGLVRGADFSIEKMVAATCHIYNRFML